MLNAQRPALEAMIKNQLLPGHVLSSRVLAAISSVPRSAFVPPSLQHVAYTDEDLEISAGRYLMEPLVFARLLELADIKENETVLDVGCASGYSAVVLSRLAKKVIALEENDHLLAVAQGALASLKIGNVELLRGSLASGAQITGGVDAIIFEGALQHVPAFVLNCLRENGRAVAVMQSASVPFSHLGKATVYRKVNGVLQAHEYHDASVPLLPGFEHSPHFKL